MLEVAQYCIVHVRSCSILRNIDRCPITSHAAGHNTHNIDRQLYDSG